MAKLGKRMREALEKVESLKEYELMEAVTLARKQLGLSLMSR